MELSEGTSLGVLEAQRFRCYPIYAYMCHIPHTCEARLSTGVSRLDTAFVSRM